MCDTTQLQCRGFFFTQILKSVIIRPARPDKTDSFFVMIVQMINAYIFSVWENVFF